MDERRSDTQQSYIKAQSYGAGAIDENFLETKDGLRSGDFDYNFISFGGILVAHGNLLYLLLTELSVYGYRKDTALPGWYRKFWSGTFWKPFSN
jgi:hypothetical protein